jgi:multidrug resistance efflux pump
MKLLTTPDDLGPCQVYCEQLKDEVRRLRANVDLMKPGDVFVCQKHFAEVEQTTEEDKSCQYCERDTAQAEATRLRAYVLKASVAATEREAALTDVSRLEAALAAALAEVEQAFTDAYQLGSDDNEAGDYLRPARWQAWQAAKETP